MKKALTYGAGLIALYLAVAGKGTSTLINAGSSGSVNIIKSLQGR